MTRLRPCARFGGRESSRELGLTETDVAAAGRLGNDLIAAIAGKQAWPDQIQAIEAQRQRFRNIIAFHKDHWPYEQKYWQDKGWM